MKHLYNRIFALAAVALLSLVHSNAFAQSQPTISYQGVLQNNGANMNGIDTLKILIYSVETGGSPIYSETQAVSVANGVFNMAIGSVTPLLPTLDFTKQYYLAVSMNGAPELSPRSEVSFAPYAFRALNADTASYASTATIAKGVSGGVVTNINGFYGPLTLSGANGITIANSVGNLTVGNNGVQSVNTVGGKVVLVGSGGTTIADTGTTITIHSQTFTGGTGIQAIQNSDSSITVANGSGPIATVALGKQNADTGQILAWNGSAWRPTALSNSLLLDSIKDLHDARDDGSSVYLGAGSGVNNSGKNSNVALGIMALHSNATGYENTAIGDSALFSNTGVMNVAVGWHALSMFNGTSVQYLSQCVAVGAGALQQNTTGAGNTAIGFQSLNSLDSATYNTACGYQAMSNGNSGGSNSAFGSWALQRINGGSGNVAVGYTAMWFSTTASGSVAVGNNCMADNRTGSTNTAIGSDAMSQNDSGWSNVAVGVSAGRFSRRLSNLVAIGDSALYNNGFSPSLDSASANTAIGSKALLTNTMGAYNTGTGFHALYGNTIGYRNTALGYIALNQNASGSDNTAIGDNAGPSTTNLSNTTTLGSGAQATTNGQVVLGNANVTSLYCQGAYAAVTANAANLVVASNGQIMRSTSSARYKTNIHDLDINTDKLYDLRPVSYISKIDGNPYFGLVAEDVAKVIPEMAEYARSKDVIPGSKSDELIPDAVKYPMLSVLLLEELKKEHAKVQSEAEQVASQAKIIADLERRVEALEALQKGVR